MKFSKTVGNSWYNGLLDGRHQPGVPGEALQERHDRREELHTPAATGWSTICLFPRVAALIHEYSRRFSLCVSLGRFFDRRSTRTAKQPDAVEIQWP